MRRGAIHHTLNGLFVANALIEKIFHVDVLPVVGMMCGASPLDPPKPAAATSTNNSQPQPQPQQQTPSPAAAFAAFAQNFANKAAV